VTGEPKKRSEHEREPDEYEPGNASTERALSNELMRRHTLLNCERTSLIRAPAYDPKRLSHVPWCQNIAAPSVDLVQCAYERHCARCEWSLSVSDPKQNITQRLTQRDTLEDEGPEGPREDQKRYCRHAKQR
jgi:hypothetical protein